MRLCELLPDCCQFPEPLLPELPGLPELALRPDVPPDAESLPELPDEPLELPLLRSSLRSAIVCILRMMSRRRHPGRLSSAPGSLVNAQERCHVSILLTS